MPIGKTIRNPYANIYIYGGVGCGKSTLIQNTMKKIALEKEQEMIADDCSNIGDAKRIGIGYYEIPCTSRYGTTEQKRLPLIYTTYSKMEYNLKIEPKVLAEYAQVKLLIIDDVGVSKRSEYAPDSLLTILDEREGTNLPTIVISNLSLAEISQLIDDRVASRLSAFQVVTWEDLQPENKTGKPIDYRATKIPEKCELD